MRIDSINSIGVVDTVTTPGIHIEVDAVLCGLAFRDSLEQQTWAGTVWVHDCSEIVAILLRDVVGVGKRIPGVESGGWWLQHVLEGGSPEARQIGRIGSVKRNLNREAHGTSLGHGSTALSLSSRGTVPGVEITPGQVLAELTQIREQLEKLSPDSPLRPDLLLRRAELRQAAREAADSARSPDALQAELEHLERRLAAFEGEKINVPAWQMAMSSGGRLTINDPAAHASKLNEALDEANSMDRQAVEERIAAIKNALAG